MRHALLRLGVAASMGMCCTVLVRPAFGAVIDVTYDQPTLDRWMYPFNGTPGTRGDASTFTSLDIPEFDQFDERDGQVLLGFVTGVEVPSNLPLSRYSVTAARLVIMEENDETFIYDPTYDSFTTYLSEEDPEHQMDTDPGRPIIVSGAGYRNQFVDEPFPENGPFDNEVDEAPRTRNVYPITYVDGTPIDISNNVEDRFEVTPFAVGQIADLAAGELVPNRTDIEFQLDVSDPNVQEYLRASLQRGRLDLVLSSLHFAEVFGSNTYPTYYMKENFAVPTTAAPARLELSVQVSENDADINGDGVVDVQDLVLVIVNWGVCPVDEPCPADIDGNGVVDVGDLVTVIVNWG